MQQMRAKTSITVSWHLCESARADFEADDGQSSNLARCFVEVFPEQLCTKELEQTHLVLTPVHSASSTINQEQRSAILEFRLGKDGKGEPFFWFQFSLALLPERPIRITLYNGVQPGEPEPQIVLELVQDQVLVHEEVGTDLWIENLDEGKLDREPFWFDNLAYAERQSSWLLLLGACLIQHHDPNTAYQVVRFLVDENMYEYALYVANQGTPGEACYRCSHDELWEIAWEHALDWGRFELGLEAERGDTGEQKRQEL